MSYVLLTKGEKVMEQKIKNGLIHCHTEYSIKDSALSPKELLKTAAEYGAPAVVLTDHGVLSGVFEFMNAASEINAEFIQNGSDYQIKAIPGIEAYFEDDNDTVRKRAHMLLIPKNYEGYQGIMKTSMLANKRKDEGGFPRMNKNIIEECFGPTGEYHNKVIATSACIGGILCQILLRNEKVSNEIDKLKNKLIGLCNPASTEYQKTKCELETLAQNIKSLAEAKREAKKAAGKSTVKLEKTMKALEGTEGYDAAKRNYEQAVNDINNAKEALAEYEKEYSRLVAEKKKVKSIFDNMEKTVDKFSVINNQIKEKEKLLTDESKLYSECKAEAKYFSDLFGEGNFYIELQYHGIPQEVAYAKLLRIAKELNLPTVATNDVHIARKTANDRLARQIQRSQRFNTWEEEMVGDSELYIKTDDELFDALTNIMAPQDVTRAIQGIADIVNQCDVVFPKENHYPVFVGHINGENSEQRLRRLAEEGIKWRYPNPDDWTDVHRERLEMELAMIHNMGYDDYHCIVQDFLDYGRRKGVDNEYAIGLGVGPGRGSAVGSLVCYLIGITSLDPIKYDLYFERYLNPERVSMPDIDSDFRTDIRGDVVDYVRRKYGRNAVCLIQTRTVNKPRSGIEAIGRMKKISLDKVNAVKKEIPTRPDIKFKTEIDGTTLYESLRNHFKGDSEAMMLIDGAKSVENVVNNYGVHAAGVVIADNDDINKYVPLTFDEDNGWICECVKEEVEHNAHLLKMDFLGLKNLNIITETLQAIKKNYGVSVDMDNIPFESEVFKNIYAKGLTNGVFQFESAGMKEMLRRFQPESFEDIILLVAAYRPGPIQYIDDIIAVKHKKKSPKYIIPGLETIFGKTYGKPIYQEQIMNLFNKFAGFSLGEADIVRRIMSKKKIDALLDPKTNYRGRFIDGLVKNGAKREDANSLWNEMLEFSKYAFNKSHAAAYALVSYYTAYLKYHYPTEYMCAVMNHNEKPEKLATYINDCREMGIKVLPPNVNKSQDGFTGKDNEILFGFGNIKGVGSSGKAIIEARKTGFKNFKDFLKVTNIKKDALEALINVGTFDYWGKNRKAFLNSYETIKKYVSDIEKYKTEGEKTESLLASQTEDKKIKQLTRKLNDCNKKASELQTLLDEYILPVYIDEDRGERLSLEKNLLGFYVSGHPIDEYPSSDKVKTCNIDSITAGKHTIVGVIEDYKDLKTKKKNESMCSFKISDKSGTISSVVFPKVYAKFPELLTEGNVLAFWGECRNEETGTTEEGIVTYTNKFIVNDVKQLTKSRPVVIVSVHGIADWAENKREAVSKYIDSNGCVLMLFDEVTGEIRKTKLLVNKSILSDETIKSKKAKFKI